MNNSVTWRDAVPADLPRILELWDEQEKRFAGTNVRVDRPQLFWEEDFRPQENQNQKQVLPLIHADDADKQQGKGYCQNQNQNPNQEENQQLSPGSSDSPRALRSSDSPRALRAGGWRYRPPIMRLRVAEKAGQLVGFRYVEAVPEVCLVTGDEDVMKTLGRELTEECYLFKRMGFRSGWGLVPEKFAKALARFTRYSPVRLWKGLRLIGCDFSELGD